MDTTTERTVILVCMRHGLIDSSAEAALRVGNPPLDRAWARDCLPAIAERLKNIRFNDLLSGKLTRMYETALELNREIIKGGGKTLLPAYYHECLDARTDDLREYIAQAHMLLREIVRRNDDDVTALAIMDGEVMTALRAVAQGRSFSSREEMAAWASNGNGVGLGEIWSFRYTPKNGKLEEVPFDDL